MISTAPLETLVSYVPALVVRRLAADPARTPVPMGERFPAAVLFADISDFTRLAEQLRHRMGDPAGAEHVAHCLNSYFGRFIELVTAHGGEVAKFAGDALVTLWPARLASGPSFGADEELQEATRRATQCALALQKELHGYETAPGIRLSMQMGVGAGYISAVHVGGVLDRIEFLLSGSPLTQISEAEDQALPGQVALSPEAWRFVEPIADGVPLRGGVVRALRLRQSLPLQPATIPSLGEVARPALQAYIPAAVLTRLEAGQEHWEGELRQVSVLFIHLPGYGTSIKHPYQRTLPQAQAVMQTLQRGLYRYEGSINKLNVDNKGITLVAAMGLPPFAHEDDPFRAVKAALDIHAELALLNRPSTIGVTTGQVFCGSIGHRLRREYTMVGDPVNLASRLMESLESRPQRENPAVLVDQATYQAVRDDLALDALDPVPVKGKQRHVPIFRPAGGSGGARVFPSVSLPRPKLEGRDAEMSLLGDRLQNLRRQRNHGRAQELPAGTRNLIIVEGQAGLGKTRLLEEVADRAGRMKLYVLTGAGERDGWHESFAAWRDVFSQLFEVSPLLSLTGDGLRSRVLSKLPASARERGYPILALRYAPLLNAVLPLELPPNDFTASLEPEKRERATHLFLMRLLTLLLQRSRSERRLPAVFVFDDVHLFDRASLDLLLEASQRIWPTLFVVATRPVPQQPPNTLLPDVYQRLKQAPNAHVLHLAGLSSEVTLSLVRKHLGVRSIHEWVAGVIETQGQGNPRVCLELVDDLLDKGLIATQQGVCVPASSGLPSEVLGVPQAVHKMVLTTLDALPHSCQLLLKTASVIGPEFSLALLRSVYPLALSESQLTERMQELAALGLVEPRADGDGSDGIYRFTSRYLRQTLYELLLHRQRRQLHERVDSLVGEPAGHTQS